MYDDKEIEKIINLWKKEGRDIIKSSGGAPVHPEYIYRLSGEWVGWNNFCGVGIDDEKYFINFERDLKETMAFSKMCH